MKLLTTIQQQQQQASGNNNEYFKKFIEITNKYEELVAEQQNIGELQQENTRLIANVKEYERKYNKLQMDLQEKSEKIKSLENISIEFKLQSTDETKLKIEQLEKELAKCKGEILNLTKVNNLMKNDLKENSELMEKTDLKNEELVYFFFIV